MLPKEWNEKALSAFRERLLAWYHTQKRVLPWREDRDPYRVWISELMLQQTRVDQVIPYFERFVAAFPDVHTLAQASLNQVLKQWEGMGYYARARNMHRAAQQIVEEFGGQIPETTEHLSGLPGIGPYTAAAISSIAYDQDVAVLDGNVTRVLCRLFAIREEPTRSAVKKRLRELTHTLLPQGKAAAFNQAMMELGSLVCTPRAPQCVACPGQTFCQANRSGDPEALPVKSPRKIRPHYDVSAGIIWRDGRILIAQRKPEGLLGGLWEFPGGKKEPGETLAACLVREVREELDIEIAVERPFMRIKHAYTHFRITLHTFHCRYVRGDPRTLGCADWQWVRPEELPVYAFPRADQKVLQSLLGEESDATLRLFDDRPP